MLELGFGIYVQSLGSVDQVVDGVTEGGEVQAFVETGSVGDLLNPKSISILIPLYARD